ncbi:MAG: hypothetical protein ACOYL5_01125 [Phototrophicaceae bacterium]|jgi:hypothetical protein
MPTKRNRNDKKKKMIRPDIKDTAVLSPQEVNIPKKINVQPKKTSQG